MPHLRNLLPYNRILRKSIFYLYFILLIFSDGNKWPCLLNILEDIFWLEGSFLNQNNIYLNYWALPFYQIRKLILKSTFNFIRVHQKRALVGESLRLSLSQIASLASVDNDIRSPTESNLFAIMKEFKLEPLDNNFGILQSTFIESTSAGQTKTIRCLKSFLEQKYKLEATHQDTSEMNDLFDSICSSTEYGAKPFLLS